MMKDDKKFSNVYNKLESLWQMDPANKNHYAGFFKNYFRNREDEAGFDDKVIWQVSKNFLEKLKLCLFFSKYHDQPIYELVNLTEELLKQGTDLMETSITELCSVYPELHERLLDSKREFPCTIRFMRYRAHSKMGTSPHVDKTVMSTILWNSDQNDQQKLAFPESHWLKNNLSRYRAVECRSEEQSSPAYLFWGTALSEAGFDVLPTSHAVLPVTDEKYRYSIAVFWLLPEFDMTQFKTAVVTFKPVDELKIAA